MVAGSKAPRLTTALRISLRSISVFLVFGVLFVLQAVGPAFHPKNKIGGQPCGLRTPRTKKRGKGAIQNFRKKCCMAPLWPPAGPDRAYADRRSKGLRGVDRPPSEKRSGAGLVSSTSLAPPHQ